MFVFLLMSAIFSYPLVKSYQELKIQEITNKQNAILQLVEHSITPVLKTGVYSEVLRFCKKIKELDSIKKISVKLSDNEILCDAFRHPDVYSEQNIYFSPNKKEILAVLFIEFENYQFSMIKILQNNYLKASFTLLIIFSISLYILLYTNLSLPISYIDKKLKMDRAILDRRKPKFIIYELFNLNRLIDEYKVLILKDSQNEIRENLNKQVAHDIKSPLAALEIVMEDLKSLPEETREITLHAVSRIKGIANNLSRTEGQSLEDKSIDRRTLISVALANIVNEKIIESQNNQRINVVYNDNTEKNSFVAIQEATLLRVISNLVNNSIEALRGKGDVVVDLDQEDEKILIKISDNGLGFPEDILKNGIMRGKTIDKKNGQGLGLWYAKDEIEKNSGEFYISNVDGGAVVEIKLGIVEPPNWFQGELFLKTNKNVVVVDDDPSIHDLWRKRLKPFRLELLHFYSVKDFVRGSFPPEDSLFLVDYDLRGELNGIELIKKFNLENAVLVTSNYDVLEVTESCKINKIKIVPKQVVPFISICF